MSTSPDISHDFANAVANTRYENLSSGAIDAAKKSILDTLGVILAASGMEPAVSGVADVVREMGGKADSSVFGFGGRAPAALAAFVNGAMAHCLDFDDRTPWGAHSGSSLIPTAFALAERRGGVSGKRMIAAVAAGQDLFIRLRCNVGWRKDWNLSTVMGVFSAAAAGSYLLGLTREQIAHAMGIASMQSSGTMALIFGTGSDLRGMYGGFSAKGAVLGALLAEKGITGIDTLFEGKAGLFDVYFAGNYDRAKMLENLGKAHLGAGMLYKPWPVVGISHTYIHAAIELMKEHRLAAADIEQVRVFVGEFQQQMCQPLESRRKPGTAVDAKFSLPFSIALATTHGQIKTSDFTAAALKDPEVLAMAQKVVPVDDSSADWKTKSPEGRVQIVTRDGRTLERRGDIVPGSPEAPMTWDDLAAKFRDCASLAAVPVSAERIATAEQMARSLETLDDVTEIVRVLS